MAEATWLWDAESIIFNRGRSVASWTFTGKVFHHAQRPVERALPSFYNNHLLNFNQKSLTAREKYPTGSNRS